MRARTLLAWIAVGLIGLALAAGVTYAATQLSSQRIGLSAEPPSAGEELAPPAHRHTAPPRTTTAPPATPATPTQTTGDGPTTGPRQPPDDSQASGGHEERGEGSHRGGDWDD